MTECEIELTYKEKKSRLKYPVKEPLVLLLDNCFTCDNKIDILLLQRESATRLKKIAKGQINIYKKYFNYTKKYKEEKWVYLDLFNVKSGDTQNTMILQTVSSTGKIFMKVALMNPPVDEEQPTFKGNDGHTVITQKTVNSVYTTALKNNLKILDKTKENIKANKTEKFRSISENTNEYLRNLKNRKYGADEYVIEEVDEIVKAEEVEPDDGLSDVEESVVDGNEDDLHLNLGSISPEVDLMISKLRELFERQSEEIIPINKEEIKQFIRNVWQQIENLSSNYAVNMKEISEINKKIKFQAKNYFEKYKEIKAHFDRERRELRSKTTILEYEISLNNEENSRLRSLFNDVKSELLFFRTKVGIKIENDPPKDEDFILLSKILSETKNDVDLTELDEQTKYNLNSILSYYNVKEGNGNIPNKNNLNLQIKNETVHFSDNEENDHHENLLKNNNNKEDVNSLVAENVLLYNKTYKLKDPVRFNHVREDEYDFNGVSARLSVIDSQVLVLDKNNNWITLNEFLSTNFSSKAHQ
jgi:flagellar biosynthesis chaperone FliJ